MNIKPKNPELYTDERLTRLRSQADAEERREKSVDSLRVRLPKGMREQIKSHVATLPEYTSVNSWVIDVLTQALSEQHKTCDIDNKDTE